MTHLQVHGACFDGATSLEQPELIANEGAALSGLGPQQSAMQRQEDRTGVGEKLEMVIWAFSRSQGLQQCIPNASSENAIKL